MEGRFFKDNLSVLGAVGIGTNNPQRLVTLYKSSTPVLQLVNSTTGTGTGDGFLLLQGGLNTTLENSEAGYMAFRTTANEKMRIDASGNVSIGTTTSGSKLHVNGGSKYFGGGDWTTIERVTTTEGNYALYVQTTGTNTNQAIAKFNYGATAGGANTGTAVAAIAREKSYFLSRLGVGTDDPTRPLSVYKSTSGSIANFLHYTDVNNYQGLYIDVDQSTDIVKMKSSGASAGGFAFYTGTLEKMRIDSAGRVGIGTDDPDNTLHVRSGSTNSVARFESTDATARIILEDNSGQVQVAAIGDETVFSKGSGISETVRIDSAGNVGIGTVAPSQKLEVVGSIKITGSGNDLLIQDQQNQVIGGFGANTTGGTTDWNHSTNARSGNGHTLLLGSHTNGPGASGYYHPFSFEYNYKNGNGNMTQFAIPYSNGRMFLRTRYSNSWSGWYKVFTSQSTGTLSDGSVLFAGGGEIKQDNANFKWDDTNNRLGIGTASPSNPLHVVSGDNVLATFESTDANATLYLKDSNTTASSTFKRITNDLAILESGGKVGIGTATPVEKLDINGNLNIDTGTGFSRYLFLEFDQTADETWVKLTLPQDSNSTNNGGSVKVRVNWLGKHATFGASQEYLITYSSNHGSSGYPYFSDVHTISKTFRSASYMPYAPSSTPDVIFYTVGNAEDALYFKVKGYHSSYNKKRQVSVEINGRTVTSPVLSHYGNTSPTSPSSITKAIEFNTAGDSYFNGGNLGIGTDNPKYKLDANAGLSSGGGIGYPVRVGHGSMATNGDGVGVLFSRGSSEQYFGYVRIQSTQSNPDFLNPRLEFGIQDTDTFNLADASTRMVITGAGNVGIGTVIPSKKLHVSGDSLVTGYTYINDTNRYFTAGGSGVKLQTAYGYIQFGPDNSSWAHINTDRGSFYFNKSVTVNQGLVQSYDENLSLNASATTSADIIFKSGGTERMRMTAAGDVGIGTASPLFKLHVNGDIYQDVGYSIYSNANRGWYRGNYTTTGSGVSNGKIVTLNPAHGQTASSNYHYIFELTTIGTSTDSGATYIGVYSANTSAWSLRAVSLSGGSSNHPQLSVSGNNFTVYTNHSSNYTVVVSVTSVYNGDADSTAHSLGANYQWQRAVNNLYYNDGFVGIGAGTPSQKLHVQGNLRVTGAFYDSNNAAGTSGQVLTSTGSATDWKSISEITGVTGTGTPNKLPLWDSSTSLTDSIITQSSTSYVTVFGGFQVSGNHTDTGSQLNLWCDSSGHGKLAVYDMQFLTGSNSARNNTALFLKNDGSVGINNTVSQAYTNEGTRTVKLRVGSDTLSSNQSSAIQIGGYDSSGSGTLGAIEFFNHRDNSIAAKMQVRRDLESGSKLSAGQLDFYTDDGDNNLNLQMSIDALGNVGIGTTSPTQKLVVNGNNTNALFKSSGTSGVDAGIEIRGGRNGTVDDETSYIHFTNYDDNASPVGVHNLGRIYGSMASAQGRDGTITIEGFDGTSYQHGLTVDENGKVGIGTANPSTDFSVKENLLFNDTTRLLTISNSTNTGGINLDGGNSRLYFSGYRALEGNNSGTTLTVGEGYATTRISSVLNVVDHETILSPDQGSSGGVFSRALTIENINDTAWTADALTAYNATTSYDIRDRASYSFFARPTLGNILTFASETVNNGTLHRFVNLNSSTTEPLYRWDFFQYDGSGTGSGDFKVPDKLFQIRVREGGANVDKFTIKGNGNVGIGTTNPTSKLHAVGLTSGASVLKVDGASGTIFEVTDDLSDSLMSVNTIAGLPVFEVFADNHIAAGRYNQNDFYLDTNGNLGLGTSAPSSVLDIYEQSGKDNKLRFHSSTTGSGTSNGSRIGLNGAELFINNIENDAIKIYTQSTQTNGITILGNGNVGIGTTSPNHELEVSGSGDATIRITSTSTNISDDTRTGTLQYFSSDTSSNTVVGEIVSRTPVSNYGTIFDMAFSTYKVNSGALSEKMRITGAGKVGIGTTSPTATLHVKEIDTDEDAILKINPNNGSYDPVLQFTPQDGTLDNEGFEIWYDNNVGDAHLHTIYNNNAAAIRFHTRTGASKSTSNERLTIAGDGNVGIGTTGPEGKLHIYTGDSGGTVNSSADELVIESASSGGIQLLNGSTASGYILFGDGGGNSTGQIRYLHSDDSMRLTTANVERMIITSAGNVGVGTASPTEKLHVNGLTKLGASGKTEGGAIIGLSSFGETKGVLSTILGNSIVPGTTSSTIQRSTSNIAHFLKINETSGITFHTGLQTTEDANVAESTNEKVRINLAGSVGIGTISPANTLHVNSGGTNTVAKFESTDIDARIRIADDSSYSDIINSNGSLSVTADVGNTVADSYFRVNIDNSEKLRIISDGNVGIGTTSPTSKLQIIGSTSGDSVLKVDGTNGTLFEVVDDLSDSLMSVNDAAGLPVFEVFADNHIVAGRYNQNDFYLNTSGNLGLGTSSPITKLNIKGDQSANGQLYIEPTNDSEYAGLVIKTTRGADRAYGIFVGGTGTDDLNFRFRDATAGADRMVIDSSGKVGIGTTVPDSRLDVRSASGSVGLTVGNTTGDTRLQISSTENSDVTFNVGDASSMGTSRDLIIKTGNSERMRILGGGNVGIGTTTPSYKLHVAGTAHTTGNFSVGNGGNGGGASISPGGGTAVYALTVDRSGSAGGSVDIWDSNSDSVIIGALSNERTLTVKVGGNVGIGTVSPAYGLDNNRTSIRTNSYTAEKVFGIDFPNSTANQKVDISFPYLNGTVFWGYLEVTITSSYSNQLSTGKITKVFSVGLNTPGGTSGNYTPQIYDNTNYYTSVYGAISSQWGIEGINFNTTTGQYYITIAHRVSTGNGIRVSVKAFGFGSDYFTSTRFGGLTAGSVYTTDTTVFDAAVIEMDQLGIGTASPDGNLEIWESAVNTAASLRLTGDPDAGANTEYANIIFHSRDSITGANGGEAQIRAYRGNDRDAPYLNFDLANTGGTLQQVMTIHGQNNAVGIGAVTPGAKLHVTQTATGEAFRIDGASGGFAMIVEGGTSYKTRMRGGVTIGNSYGASTPPANGLIVEGSVGIGTTTPNQKLTVADGKFDTVTAMGTAGQWSSSQIRLETTNTVDTTGWQGISFDTSTADNYGWSIGANRSGSGRGSFRVYEHIGTTAGTERFTIEQDGNVGIGVADPSAKLHVAGNTYLNSGSNVWNLIGNNGINFARETYFGYSSTYRILQLGTAGATRAISIGVDVSSNASGSFGGDEIIFPNQREIITPNAAGNGYLGLIATDNQNKVRIGNYRWNILNDTPGITIDTSTSANNVGIGSASPTEKLYVNGSIALSSTAHKIGFRDATGMDCYIIFDDNNPTFVVAGTNHATGGGMTIVADKSSAVQGNSFLRTEVLDVLAIKATDGEFSDDLEVNGSIGVGGDLATSRVLTITNISSSERPAIKIVNPNFSSSTSSTGKTFYRWLPIDIGGTTRWIAIYQ